MRITKLKKKIAVAVATATLILSSAFISFAADPPNQTGTEAKTQTETQSEAPTDPFDSTNKSIREDLGKLVNELTTTKHEDTANKLQTIIDVLDELDNDDAKFTDAKTVKALIEEVIKDEAVLEATGWTDRFDTDATIFETAWLNALGDAVAPYGISMNTYSYATEYDYYGEKYTYMYETSKTNDSAGDRAEDSSTMIQKLRWSEKDSNSKLNITTILKEFEIHFGNVNTLFQSVAAALVIAFGASNLLKMTADRMVSYDAVLREFFKLLIGVWFIFNYRYFTILILRIGTYVTEIFLDGTGNWNSQTQTVAILRHSVWESFNQIMQNNSVDNIFSGLKSATTNVYGVTQVKTSWLEDFGTALCGLFGGQGLTDLFGDGIVSFALNLVVYALLIELGIRYVFTPIAIADLYSEGSHSNGARWLKKMLSCVLTGGLMYLTMYGANVIKAQLTGFHPVQLAVVNLTMTGSFVKCRQLADEIVGVR